MTTHKCPGVLCGGRVQVPASRLMCREDWFAVPVAERDAVNAAWDRGRGRMSAAHRAAVRDAIEANRREGTR